MILHILFSILFTYNSLNAFPPGAEIGRGSQTTKKIRLLYHKPIAYSNPITCIIFLTNIMKSERNIPEDITSKILEYSIKLKTEDCIKKFPHLHEWYDYDIPLYYQYALTSEQLNTFSNLFINNPRSTVQYSIHTNNGNKRLTPTRQKIYYRLQSKDHYKLFLELPIEVRICLTKRPQTELAHYPRIKNQDINTHKRILVLNENQTSYDKKPILPKTKTKHEKALSLEQQVYILEKLSRTRIVKLEEYGTFYVFSSKKNYKQFLTLPETLRKPIADSSNNTTGIIQKKSKWDWDQIGTVVKLKPIILNNKNKKISLPKILINQNEWCYCM